MQTSYTALSVQSSVPFEPTFTTQHYLEPLLADHTMKPVTMFMAFSEVIQGLIFGTQDETDKIEELKDFQVGQVSIAADCRNAH